MTDAMLALIPERYRDRAKAVWAALASIITPVVGLVILGETRPLAYVLAVLAALGLGGGLTYLAPANQPRGRHAADD